MSHQHLYSHQQSNPAHSKFPSSTSSTGGVGSVGIGLISSTSINSGFMPTASSSAAAGGMNGGKVMSSVQPTASSSHGPSGGGASGEATKHARKPSVTMASSSVPVPPPATGASGTSSTHPASVESTTAAMDQLVVGTTRIKLSTAALMKQSHGHSYHHSNPHSHYTSQVPSHYNPPPPPPAPHGQQQQQHSGSAKSSSSSSTLTGSMPTEGAAGGGGAGGLELGAYDGGLERDEKRGRRTGSSMLLQVDSSEPG